MAAAAPEPAVDVIVVSYNGVTFLERAIKSVASTVGIPVRTIVVDNASTDQSVGTASRLGATVVSLPNNVGYGSALNVGLAAATAEWVVCANQDIEVDPDTVATLVAAATMHESDTAVRCVTAPRLITSTGETAETCHELPTLPRQMVAFLVGEKVSRARNRGGRADDPQVCGWVSAVFLLGRRSTFAAAGGFDPSYFMYVEDLDFFSRLARVGYHCLWVPAATVRHFGGRSKKLSPSLYADSLRNWRRYYARKHGALGGYAILSAAVVGCLLRALLWWCRSWKGDTDARAYAQMFFGAATATMRKTPARESPVGSRA